MHLSMIQPTDIGYRQTKNNRWNATVIRQCLEEKYYRHVISYGMHKCSSVVLIGAAHMIIECGTQRDKMKLPVMI